MAAMDDDTGPSACRRGRGDDPCPPNAPARKKQKTPEVRAQALLQLGRLEGLASASVEPPRERPHATVAREFNVGVSTVRRWERQVEDGDGTGRRLTKHTHQFLARREAGEDVLRSEMLKDRVATQRELARATGASKSTVGRQQERLQVKHLSVFARPWMNADHLHRRVEWANRPWDTDTLSHTAWFDEKWVHQKNSKKYTSSPDAPPYIEHGDRNPTHRTKVMVIACASSIGILYVQAVSECHTAKRDSKFHKKGETHEKPTNMDSNLTAHHLRAMGAVIRAVYGWGFPFQLISDNGGHGWSKNDNIFNVHAKMMLDDFGITLLRQPRQSPDLNIWDQHLWRAWGEDLAVLPKGKKATKEQVAAAVIEIYKNMSRYTCLFGIEKVQFSQRELVKHGGSPVASDTAKHRDIDALLEQRWGSAAVQLAKTQGPPPEADIGGQCTGRPVSAMPRPGREAAEVDSVDYLL